MRYSGKNAVRTRLAKAKAATAGEQSLLKIINPDVRDRWLTQTIRYYTPEQVESIIRGAVYGDLEAVWQLFDLMEGTWDRLAKDLGELRGAVRSLTWSVEAWAPKGEEPSPRAEMIAAMLEDAIWNMKPRPAWDENDFETTLDGILDAWGKGVSLLEINWELARTRFGQAIVPVSTQWVHPKYYGYPPTGADRLMLNATEIGAGAGLQTEGRMADLPEDKFIVSICKAKVGHPIGSQLLRPIAFWWAARNFTMEWFLNFAQIFGAPIRWATYDPNASQETITVISDMLENMGSMGWAAFPSGTTMDLKEAAKSGTDNPQAAIINLADKACDILILRQTLTTDAGDRGTQALGTVHQSVRGDVIDEAAGFAAKVLSRQLAPAFCRLNFGDDSECPWFSAKREGQGREEHAERDNILVNFLDLPKNWLYERHGVPMPQEGEQTVGPKSRKPLNR